MSEPRDGERPRPVREEREVVTLADGRRAQVVRVDHPDGGKSVTVTPLTVRLTS